MGSKVKNNQHTAGGEVSILVTGSIRIRNITYHPSSHTRSDTDAVHITLYTAGLVQGFVEPAGVRHANGAYLGCRICHCPVAAGHASDRHNRVAD